MHEARAILQSGLRSFPKSALLLQGLGHLELRCGNIHRARQYLKEAIRAEVPGFANPYHALGTMEHLLGNIRVATTVLRMGLKHCPCEGDLYREAKMLDMAENDKKGLECIDAEERVSSSEQKKLNWSRSFIYSALSYVAYDKGEKAECRKWLKRSVVAESDMHSQGWYV